MSLCKFPKIKLTKKRRRTYDLDQIVQAYKAVKEDGMSVYRAAKEYGIPESTLRDRHLGLQPVDSIPRHGPETLFTKEEEQSLIDHMTSMANIGHVYSRQGFLDMAFEYAVTLGKKSRDDPTFKNSWLSKFRGRWPDFEFVKPKTKRLATAKDKLTSRESMNKHLTELEVTYKQYKLDEHPERIWNVDECVILMEHCQTNDSSPKEKTPKAATSPRGKNVTLIGCANATGSSIPPYYIFPGKRWDKDLLDNTCPGAAGELSETGWSNSVAFKNYLENHFLKFVNIGEGQTHLIIFDGHKSHVSLPLTNWGKDHGIVFHVSPQHTSQPLDVACFGPLKALYNTECQTYMRKNPGHSINRSVVGELSSNAYLKAFSPYSIVCAFRNSGLFPLGRDKTNARNVEPSVIYQSNENEEGKPATTEEQSEQFFEIRKIVAEHEIVIKKRKLDPDQEL